MNETSKPWEIEPVLTPERLRLVAELLLEVRTAVMKAQEPEKGDALWGGCCRSYERTCFALYTAAASGKWPWLYAAPIKDNLLQIDFRISGVPFRHFRGDPDNPSTHHVDRAQAQMNLAFPGAKDDTGSWCWAMVMNTDGQGNPIRVVVEQMNEAGEVRNQWTVPRPVKQVEETVGAQPMARPGRPIPPPAVTGPSSGTQADGDSKKKDGSES